MVVWGGVDGEYNNSRHNPITGGRYDPATDSWTTTSTVLAPTPRQFHTAVWTGSSMVVWGGLGDQYCDTGGRYDPVSDTWAPTSTVGAPSARFQHSAVWTGSLVLIFGGDDGTGSPSVGGQYDPAADTWSPISATGEPYARAQHTAIWTGSRMVVWGGKGYPVGLLNTGGRYDPVSDTWAPTSVLGAPAARYEHSGLWTGSSLVVWGGSVNSNVRTNTGGRYDPGSDTWTPTSTTSAPAARHFQSGVWTGREMVVWGGRNSEFGDGELNTGGRYDPAADTWAATSTTGAPVGRDSHTAVWTGTFMIVWSGWPDLTTGGRYIICDPYDHDGDGYAPDQGDCDDTNSLVHPGASEICNGIDDNCDGQIDWDAQGIDSDSDGIQDACDNCPLFGNSAQSDFDHDGEGDVCDGNDGLILIYGTDDRNYVEWQAESGYTTWNSYRGSLTVLRETGQYTQSPGSNPLAGRDCGLADPWVYDDVVPGPGEVEFSLVTGVVGGVESGLGTNRAGVPRANANPCP
jgi:N-acetylneuraminic acid mutarotase